MSITQTGRWLSMTTPLGADVLIATAISGREQLSSLYSFKIDCFSTNTAIQPGDLLGQHASATVQRGDGTTRVFSGIVRSIASGPMLTATHRAYQIELVPPLWLLTRTSDCRVFQSQTAMDIVEAVLKEGSITGYKKKTSGSFVKRDCCVQFNETDFAFVSRLLESIGVFYYFEHGASATTMVMGNATTAWFDCVDAEVTFRAGDDPSYENVNDWQDARRFVSGKWALKDYDFENPDTDLAVTETTVLSVSSFKTWERFEYPGPYKVKADGTADAKVRMATEEAEWAEVAGRGAVRGFAPGAKFKLSRHPVSAEAGKSFVVTEVTHEARDPTHFSRDPNERPFYRNSFSCLPDSVLFRPPWMTPKPRMAGPQTATVVGPSGEEIHCDKYGRIRVLFRWDRLGKKDDTAFCWVRLAQPMAGAKWGIYSIPRVGMEVLVDFLNGDPDYPVVVACLTNATNMPPYDLPTDRTKSGIKTRSSPSGDATMFNELRFEDKKGSEEVYVHAQKDFKRVVVNDDVLSVTGTRTLTTKGNVTETVSEGDWAMTVAKGGHSLTVSKGDHSVDVAEGGQSVTVSKGDQTIAVAKGKRELTVDGNHTVEVTKGDESLTVKAGKRTVKVDKGDDSLTVAKGAITIKATAGKITIEAGTSIELKQGSNSIKIDAGGVTIKGGSIKATASISAEIKGAQTKLEGSGMVTIKGGLVQIN
ncbi:MAG: type VI secretion system tip protein VgrG [Alphaproteobacteria bacterium]|nr:type VI secretion system tip protein VgrG [Alphaproteobacteria bacterium]